MGGKGGRISPHTMTVYLHQQCQCTYTVFRSFLVSVELLVYAVLLFLRSNILYIIPTISQVPEIIRQNDRGKRHPIVFKSKYSPCHLPLAVNVEGAVARQATLRLHC